MDGWTDRWRWWFIGLDFMECVFGCDNDTRCGIFRPQRRVIRMDSKLNLFIVIC